MAAGPGPEGIVTVVLVDDHEVVRRGLRELIAESDDLRVVAEAADVDEALAVVLRLRPSVTVLDLRLDGGSGIEVCRQVRRVAPELHILVLTAHGDLDSLDAALRAGASGYVLKRLRGAGLLESIRRVAAGDRVIDPELSVGLALRASDRGRVQSELERLTPQERRILDLVASGLSNREIAARIDLAEKTVKNYMSSILAKLGLASRTQAAIYLAHRDQPS